MTDRVLLRLAADGTRARYTPTSPDSLPMNSAGAKTLSSRRTIAETGDAAPDGIALDAEGGIWAGYPLAREFRRVVPGGEVTDRIGMGEHMAIACTLGGDDRRTLFLLSAADWSAKALEGRRTSTVGTVRVRVPGAGLP